MSELPIDTFYGKVVGQFIIAAQDATDPDSLPEGVPMQGAIKISPLVSIYKNPNPNAAVVAPVPVLCALDADGNLIDPEGNLGVWLVEGEYKVRYLLTNARIRTHRITVTRENDVDNPVNLRSAIPPKGPVLTPGQYAELSSQIAAIKAVSDDDPRLSDSRAPLEHSHDDRYYTESEMDTRLGMKASADALTYEMNRRVEGDEAILEQLGNEITLRAQGDAALSVRIELLEEIGAPDLSGFTTDSELSTAIASFVTDSELAIGLSGKANVAHSHTSASISDFREAVEDAMASTLVGSGVTITHEDGSNTITLTGVAGSDAEGVRDAIGAALIGVGPISIVPNDSGDTIVITVSATVNSTDAALRDRSTHTGQQPISSVTNLQTELDSKALKTDAPIPHKGNHSNGGSDAITPADIGAATAAQGAKADTAVQPADLVAYATDAELAAGLGTKAATSHTHTIANVTGLQDALDGLSAGSAGGMGDGMWRGPWASLSVLSTYDLNTVPAGWTNVGGWASASIPAMSGTAPTGGKAMWNASAPGSDDYLEFTIPAGAASALRLIVGFSSGNPTYSKFYVNRNGVVQWGPSMPAVNTWVPITVNAVAGQVIRFGMTDQFGFSGVGYVGQIELLTANAPYMLGHTVTYANRLWRSAVDNNTSTPGANANWVEEVLTSDIADVVGLQTALDAKMSGTGVTSIVSLSQAAYDALGTKVSTTLYVIV